MKIAKVIIEHPVASLDTPFDYYIPSGVKVLVGTRVEVEFNNQIIVCNFNTKLIPCQCAKCTKNETLEVVLCKKAKKSIPKSGYFAPKGGFWGFGRKAEALFHPPSESFSPKKRADTPTRSFADSRGSPMPMTAAAPQASAIP